MLFFLTELPIDKSRGITAHSVKKLVISKRRDIYPLQKFKKLYT